MKLALLASAALLIAPEVAFGQAPDVPTIGRAEIGAPRPSPSPSQQEAEQLTLTEVIVTAQRRAERLQDIPVAVSSYSASKRDELGILSVQDLAKFTPGVSFSESPNRLFVRGVGRFTNQLGSDPGVANYVDGFYTSETTAIGGSPILIDRVEILRGPQGTLYGRNSIGGAANVISLRPTQTFTTQIRASASNYETAGVAVSVAGPLTDWLRFRLTANLSNQGEGYLKNDAGPNYYRSRFQTLEGQFEADIGSRGSLWVKYQHYNYDGLSTINNQIDPYNTTNYFVGSSLFPSPTYGLLTPNPGVQDMFRSSLNNPGYERIRNAEQVVANASWDFGGVVLKYVGGYQTFDYSLSEDYDRTSRTSYVFAGQTVSANLTSDIADRKRFYSHELNLTSDHEGPMKFIAGLYHYNEREDQTYALRAADQAQLASVLSPVFTLSPSFQPIFAAAPANPNRAFLDLSARLKSKSYAAYGQVDYEIAPEVTLTAGLRYSRDEKEGFEARRYTLFAPGLGSTLAETFYGSNPAIPASLRPILASAINRAFATSAFDVTPTLNARSLSDSWEAFSGKAGVAWKPDRDTNLYGSFSHGYKAGGYNLYNFVDPVGKETLNAYEVGLKKTLAFSLQANLAAFYYDYHNVQVPVSFINIVRQTNFVNAPRARSIGAEAELVWSPTDTLQILVSYAYLDATFREFSGYVDLADPAAGNQDLRGNRMPQSPRNKLTVSLLNKFELGRGVTLTPVASLNYTGAQYYSPFTTDTYRQDSFVRADFRAVVQTDAGVQVNAYVNNVFNDRSFNGFQLGPEASGFARQVTINLPRTFGVELIAKF